MGNDDKTLGFTATGYANVRTYAGPLSFMRRPYSRDLTDVDVAVTGLPLDMATSNRPGARFGPRAIRDAATMIDWNRPYGCGFDPFDRVRVIDYGDCMWDYGRPDTAPASIESHIETIAEAGVIPRCLGGDHFVALPTLRALNRVHGPINLIQFDAHSDTWNEANESTRVDHGSMFYVAAKEGLVTPHRSVQIGIRTHNDETPGSHIRHPPAQ